MISNDKTLLQVVELRKHFPILRGVIISRQVGSIKAVDGISFKIQEGETLGLVGESGCGKSTAGRAIIQLYKPTSGKVLFDGVDITRLGPQELRAMRPMMQMVFQDPYASLNPRHSIGKIVAEPMVVHGAKPGKQLQQRVEELLELVGLKAMHVSRFPHEFSGGQRQRIVIARALALNPRFLVCDEPISALDVSIQAQVVNLLKDLQKELKLTYLFIAHDLSMVRHISHNVAVMYLGKIVEFAPRHELFDHSLHPYTRALISAVPLPDPKSDRQRKQIILQGEVPSPMNPPTGCVFHTRCPIAEQICSNIEPQYREINPDHSVACHLVE